MQYTSIEQALNWIVSDAADGDWESAADKAEFISLKVAQLRDRIDELGGYHDDI